MRRTTAIVVVAAAAAVGALLLTTADRRSGGTATGPSAEPAQAGPLSVSARLQANKVLVGDQDTYVAVTVAAPQAADDQRRPHVDIAIVMDRSGSMDGEKLAQARLAARSLIDQLDQDDAFSITVYGSDVEITSPLLRATGPAKADALAKLDQIYADGGTNLSGGLEAGKSTLLERLDASRVGRVILISDGQANEGIVNADQLAQLSSRISSIGLSVTTVGVGLDFDERTMTAIAVSGRGNYYFAEDAAMLATMFADELGRLGATVATGVNLVFEPNQGVEIVEAFGYPMTRQGRTTTVPIADLHSGETRKVVLHLRTRINAPGYVELARVSTRFTEVDSGKTHSVSSALRAEATHDQAAVLASRDADAIRHIERARTAQAINDATVLWESGKREEAQQMMNQRNMAVQALAADMGDAEFAAEIDAKAGVVQKNFAKPAAPSSTSGKRARKQNRKDAYDLMY